MTVQLFKHDDTSAPVLTGQVGSLTNLLDAVLVNGYGSKSAAGWTIAQTTTNKRAYKQGPGGNHPTGMHLYVNDTAPGGAGAREARVCGFETMSAITPVGTGQFPNNTQSAIGIGELVIRKSNTTDATARKWYIVADAWTLYLFIEQGDYGAPWVSGGGFMFGDFKSYKTGDDYAQMIIGRQQENTTSAEADNIACINGPSAYGVNNNMPGHYYARHWNQTNASVRGGKMLDSSRCMSGQTNWPGDNAVATAESQIGPGWCGDSRLNPYPNPVDGSLWMAPFYCNQAGMRGYLKGLYAPQHQQPFNPGDTFTVAAGDLAGKSFIAVNGTVGVFSGHTPRPAQFLIEYSDTWPA